MFVRSVSLLKRSPFRCPTQVFAKHSHATVTQRTCNNTFSTQPIKDKPLIDHQEKFYERVRSTNFDEALKVLNDQMKSQTPPSTKQFADLIAQFLDSKQINQAENLLKKMESLGHVPTQRIMRKFLLQYLTSGQPQKALQLLPRIRSLGYQLGNKDYTLLISKLSKSFVRKDAIMTVHKYVMEDIEPDTYTYSALINAYAQLSNFDKVTELVREMEEKNLPASEKTKNIVLKALCKCSLLEDALEWKNEIVSTNTASNYTFSTLISTAIRMGKLDLATELFEEMKSLGISANLVNINEMIFGCVSSGNIEKARGFFSLISESGLEPDLVTYSTMIQVLCTTGHIEEAWKLLGIVEDKGITPNGQTYFGLIQHCVKEKNWDELDSVMNLMESKNIALIGSEYDLIIAAFIKNRLINRLPPLWKSIERDCLNDRRFFSWLSTFCKCYKSYGLDHLVVALKAKYPEKKSFQ